MINVQPELSLQQVSEIVIRTLYQKRLDITKKLTDKKKKMKGQCLNTLTDDNKDLFIEFQNHPEYVQSLLNIINQQNDNILIQVLACGKFLCER